MGTNLELTADELAILAVALAKYCKSAASYKDGYRNAAVDLLLKVDNAEDDMLLGSYLTNKLVRESSNV